MTTADILELFKAAAIGVAPDGLRHDIPLVDQGIDSVDMAVLLTAVEKRFYVSIPTSVVGRLQSLDDIRRFVDGRRSGGEFPLR